MKMLTTFLYSVYFRVRNACANALSDNLYKFSYEIYHKIRYIESFSVPFGRFNSPNFLSAKYKFNFL